MLTLRSTSPLSLIDRLEQQLGHQLQSSERVPAAEVHETAEAYEVVLELPGVERNAIDVKATERTLVISAERRRPHHRSAEQEAAATEASPEAAAEPRKAPLISEFRYGTWSRSFRFPTAIEREQLQARYRD
ncbi:MAG: Hsp20/alpha crystallin family protein, partial [Cyanobium sp.]